VCDGGIGDAFVLKLGCVRKSFALGVLDMTIVCAIMFWQCEKIPSVDQMICPCTTFVGFLIHLGFTYNWSKWHFVVVEGSAEMCIWQNIGGGIRLSNQIDVILVCGSSRSQRFGEKLFATPAKTLRKWALKLYGYLGCIASVATWWHQFHIQFACVTDVILHVFRYLIVEDMFLGDNAGV
jgi:hypothetical protein